MQVWILMKGEAYDGGYVLGVYADKDIAFNDFVNEVKEIDAVFGCDRSTQDEDGAVHVTGGCDWLSLEPHDVIDRRFDRPEPQTMSERLRARYRESFGRELEY